MRFLRGLSHRFRSLLRRTSMAEELDEEIRHHIDLDVRKYVAEGSTEVEARRRALLKFGSIENAKEEARDESGVRWIVDLAADIRFGLRGLRKTPVFTAAAVISLGLGVGANTAIFSVVNGVLLRALPYPDSERLYSAFVEFRDFNAPYSAADFLRVTETVGSSASFAAYDTHGFTLSTANDSEIIRGAWVTHDFFEVLGVQPLIGRPFLADEDAAVVISHQLWLTHLSGATNLLERSLELDGRLLAVVGVMPPGFRLPQGFQSNVLAVVNVDEPPRRGPFFLRALVRLPETTDRQTLQHQLQVAKDRTVGLYPDESSNWAYGVQPLKELVVGRAERTILLLFSAVCCVLLIAVANVANLLLARSAVRRGEVALRSALGASCGRLVRQTITESILLGLLGAALGVGIAWPAVELLGTAAASFVPRMDEVGIDLRVLAFAVAVGLTAGIIVGGVPAFSVPWRNLNDNLRETTRGGGADTSRGVLRRILVVGEFALALTVLLASGLLLKSLGNLHSADLGFDDEGVVSVLFSLPEEPYENPEEFDAYLRTLEQRLTGLPGVSHFGYATAIPPDRLGMTNNYTVEGQVRETDGAQPVCPWLAANESFFGALGVPLRQGRVFSAAEADEAPGAVVVSEEFARFHFPGESAVGKRLKGGNWNPDAPWLTIVGVVGDAPYTGVGRPAHRTVYTAYEQSGRYRYPRIVLRLTADPETVLPQVRREITTLDSRVPVFSIASIRDMVVESTSTEQSLSVLFSVLALVALLLSATGIYGVISYNVSTQRREFAIRQALGAQKTSVVGGVLREGLVLAGTGVVLGCGSAYLLARSLRSILFDVSPSDVATYVVTAAILASVAVLACLVPSVRASRMDPVVALREE